MNTGLIKQAQHENENKKNLSAPTGKLNYRGGMKARLKIFTSKVEAQWHI